VATIGTSSDLMIGETVLALGNAYGYEHTVTRGIISALHRNVEVSRTQRYEDLIQTDASINPGNSGGPLLNINGEVIGINVAVRAGAQGIGFAIPIDRVLDIVSRLLSVERIDQTWHGLVVRCDGRQGAVVEAVHRRARRRAWA
jgi:serine protease Do